MAATPNRMRRNLLARAGAVSALVPDFPFDYAAYLDSKGKSPLGSVTAEHLGQPVLVVGAGVAGLVAGYECMRMGLRPVVVDASGRVGGRMFSTALGNTPAVARSSYIDPRVFERYRSGMLLDTTVSPETAIRSLVLG